MSDYYSYDDYCCALPQSYNLIKSNWNWNRYIQVLHTRCSHVHQMQIRIFVYMHELVLILIPRQWLSENHGEN